VIPGNHDIEWRHEGGEIDADAELNYRTFCKSFYNTLPLKSLLRIGRFRVVGRLVTVISLNSCRIESKPNAGLGYVGQEQIHEMLGELARMASEPGELRIGLTHHHLLPVSYVESVPTAEKHLSLTLDAEAVMRGLMCAGVQIVLHGHQHQPYFAQVRRVIDGFVHPIAPSNKNVLDSTLTIIGAGSIGVERGHLNVVGRNSYNLLELSASAPTVTVTTRVQSPVGPGFARFQETTFQID